MTAYIVRWAEIYVRSKLFLAVVPLWIYAFLGWVSRLRSAAPAELPVPGHRDGGPPPRAPPVAADPRRARCLHRPGDRPLALRAGPRSQGDVAGSRREAQSMPGMLSRTPMQPGSSISSVARPAAAGRGAESPGSVDRTSPSIFPEPRRAMIASTLIYSCPGLGHGLTPVFRWRGAMFQILKRVIGRAGGKPVAPARAAFLDQTRHAAEVQNRILLDQVARHADSQFGRDHHFGEIRTAADFRRRVPVGGYDRLEPYIDRVRQGDTRALFRRRAPRC